MGHDLARLFAFEHLPEHLQEVSRPFADLANKIVYHQQAMRDNPSLQTAALYKLWEAKNLAVVAAGQYGQG